MKKNLRNILALTLGLMTTVTVAQDWDVDSRTRVQMHGETGMMLTEQRATIGATWGGDDWGIHVSSDVEYMFGDGTEGVLQMDIYEAYASANLMGYANMTAGRQALNYGSGNILSSNDFAGYAGEFPGLTRQTWDGLTIDLGLDMADITIGYASRNTGEYNNVGLAGEKQNQMYVNLAKAEDNWNVNFLYATYGAEMSFGDGTETWSDVAGGNAMGIDLGYNLMGGDLALGASYNTSAVDYNMDGTANTNDDMTMMDLSATYNVNDDLSVAVGQLSYGEGGYDVLGYEQGYYFIGAAHNNADRLFTGKTEHLEPEDQNRYVGVDYTMGDFTVGINYNMITSTADDVAGSTVNEDYERNITELMVGYDMSDNTNLSLMYASDKVNDLDAAKYMWLTLNVTP